MEKLTRPERLSAPGTPAPNEHEELVMRCRDLRDNQRCLEIENEELLIGLRAIRLVLQGLGLARRVPKETYPDDEAGM